MTAVPEASIAEETVVPEFRGAWVTRFEWASEDPDEIRANIARIFETLEAANFNAAVFQVRGAAETLYPSELEPWSPLVGGRDPGFDPLKLAIDEAHRRGIEFHAYINPMPLRAIRSRGVPEDPDHLYHRHGPDSAEPWICVNTAGEPHESEYLYLSAAVPGVHAYLREVVLDVVRRYEVDGVHLDRIRSPGPEFGHNPVGDRRFRGRGNPSRREWGDWQREQLDKLVNDLAAEIRAERPEVALSCAAWGIYNRHHIDGYDGFSSGYHDYFQDTWNWVRLGAMDVLMPMIYWDIGGRKPDYDELLADFIDGVGADHVIGGQRTHGPDENVEEIRITREVGALGTVLFSLSGAKRRGIIDAVRDRLYQEKAPVPELERVAEPRTGGVLGRVIDENGAPVEDAWVSLRRGEDVPGRPRGVFAQTWPSSADGRFAFLDVPPGEVVVRVRYPGVETVESAAVEIREGAMSTVDIAVSGAGAAPVFVEVMRPGAEIRTADAEVHILGRTEPGNRVTVGGEEVEVYSTGAFARDGIAVDPGESVIDVVAIAPDGRSTAAPVQVTRSEPTPDDEEAEPSVRLEVSAPDEEIAVLAGEIVTVRAAGPAGRAGHVTGPGGIRAPLAEDIDGDGVPTGRYTAVFRATDPTAGPAVLRVVLAAADDDGEPLEAAAEGTVEIWDPARVRIGECTRDYAGITDGLHYVRLGGPYVARIPEGTRFEVLGRHGSKYRIRLSASRSGWISTRSVRILPDGTAPPHNYFTSVSTGGDDEEDRVAVALRDPVIVAVSSETEPSNRIHLDFYATHNALAWTSHMTPAAGIGRISGEQIEDGLFRLTIPVRSRQIWGYWVEHVNGMALLHVRRPPVIADAPDSPVKGLLIALEAGHGGPTNLGAVGLMGSKEKTVNRMAVDALQRELESRGARTVLVRPGDSNPSLRERVNRANEANADLFVSMHANATGSRRGGYLRVSGTSTYYLDPHCYPAADKVYRRLLDLGWNEFGVVGDFTYYGLQSTRVPSILVEQAFMSHIGDEARLTDPAYQENQARAIVEGLEDFLREARE